MPKLMTKRRLGFPRVNRRFAGRSLFGQRAAKAKLAMKIAGEYRLRNIRLRHWKRFATDLRLDEAWLMERIRTMAAALPDHATSIRNELEADGLSHITMTRLAQRLKARAASCLRLLR
jgi:serine/threonine-protein kinase HipA